MDALLAAYRAGERTIAVDLDDVLSQTNETVCEMHNEVYGSDMAINDFQHYLYWQNRGWGNPEETFTKVRHLYASGLMERTPPMPGAAPHLQRLQEMGFRLVLVTARSESQRAGTEKWLARYYPGVFTEAHFTGAFTQTDPLPEKAGKDGAAPTSNGQAVKGSEQDEGVAGVQPPTVPKAVVSKKKRSKADVAHSIPAMLLVDDSIENALDCATATPPVPVLLFGAYPWNRHVSRQDTPEDMLAHAERVARGIDSEAAERLGEEMARGWTGESEGQALPECVRSVRGWDEVVRVMEGVVREAGGGQ